MTPQYFLNTNDRPWYFLNSKSTWYFLKSILWWQEDLLNSVVLTQCLYWHLTCHCFRWLTMFCVHQNNHHYLRISGGWNHPAVANFTEIPNSMLVALQCPSHTFLILIVWDSIRNFKSTVASNCIKKQSTWGALLIKVSLKTSQIHRKTAVPESLF